MLAQIDELMRSFYQAMERVKAPGELLKIKADFIGKKGKLSEILKGLKDASPEERKTLGAKSNQYKDKIASLVEERLSQLELEEMNAQLNREWKDLSLRDSVMARGLQAAGYHPLSLIQREMEDIFVSMGYDILDGPHIEDDYHNFAALNVPPDHPARDLQDTFWFKDLNHLLRAQTSTIQIRGMRAKSPPFKFIAPGAAFRNEAVDASHGFVFHQVEGMMVGKDVSAANMVFFLKTLLSEIFAKQLEVRLRHGYFPFVEPGFELDVSCLFCGGKGCSICKQTGWIEFVGCGMVHPHVLEMGGVDPGLFNGFAFGLGLDRLAMLRYGIDDIRHILGGDLRFVSQFKQF